MKSGIPLMSIAMTVVGLGACANKSLTSTGTAATPMPAPAVFTCVREEIKKVGFTQESYDETDFRVVARQYNENATRPDVQFRRLVDRIAFTARPAGGDSITTVTAEASTFAQSMTYRGPTEQQEGTSDNAKAAARAVLDRCTTKP